MKERRLLKVGFVGAGGTGKTSVANLMAKDEEIKETFRPSIVREVYKRLDVPDESTQLNMSAEHQWYLQREILAEKCAQDAACSTGIFDRTPIDHMAYCLYRCGSHISDDDYENVENLVRLYTQRYNLIFFFPMYDWEKANEDGFRQSNKAYRVACSTLMLGLLHQFNIQYWLLPNTTPEDRAEYIKKAMLYLK